MSKERSGVGILYSQYSLKTCIQAGLQLNAIYSFRGADGHVRWLRGEYAYLAPNGAASLLRRLCIKFDWLADEDLIEPKNLERYHTLILPHYIGVPIRSSQALEAWVNRGGHLLVTEQTDLPPELLGLSGVKWHRPEGYTAIRYGNVDLIAGYRGYTIGIGQPASGSSILASAYEVLNPAEGISSEKDIPVGPAVIRNGKVIYITLPLFETFGAMLQGHVNFEDIRVWGHRYKYLDRVGRLVKDILEDAGWDHLWTVRVKPWGSYKGVVVLRHDVDESKDTTYLDYEQRNNIPATYAILGNHNCSHWLAVVANHPTAEAAYHFDTTPERMARLHRFLQSIKKKMSHHIQKTSGEDLWEQFKKARGTLKIPIETGQRHNSFFRYPEIVDAMDYLYKQASEVLGLGTMFRFTNFMYGARTNEDEGAYVIQHPDTSVPFWFPFKLWYADAEHHHMLRGWDITHVLEPEPWLTDHLLDQKDYLEDGVYTLGFHPAHCRGKSFRPEGNWQWFEYAVEASRNQGYQFATCREVFKRMNAWESLGFSFYEGEGSVTMGDFSDPATIYIEHLKGRLSAKETNVSVEPLSLTVSRIIIRDERQVRFAIE